jgi:hypothetical protein
MGPQSLPLPTCPPFPSNTTPPTLEDAKRIAWKYAPIVYYHPLEKYHLQDPNLWYQEATLHLWDTLPEDNSTYSTVQGIAEGVQSTLLLPRSFVTLLNSTKLTDTEREELLAGAPFDENNESTANVFFTVTDISDSLWMFNYNLYYSWNGCSNQEFVVSIEGQVEQLKYLMCPTGVHESDWCRVSVLVCKSDLEIKQTAYSQHAWMETRNCEAGQCPMEDGHPVSFAGLDGHGNYYEESNMMVYSFYNGSSIDGGKSVSLGNFGGLYIGDRTAKGEKKFVPREDNVKFIPSLDEILSENLTDFYWAAYSGQWGAPLAQGPIDLECLSNNYTMRGPCPQSQALKILESGLKLAAVASFVEKSEFAGLQPARVKLPSNTTFTSYPDIPGPLFRTFTYKWLPQHVSPIFKQNISLLVCPDDIKGLKDIPMDIFGGNSVGLVSQYMIGIAVGSILFSVVIIIILYLPVLFESTPAVQFIGLADINGGMAGMSAFFNVLKSKSQVFLEEGMVPTIDDKDGSGDGDDITTTTTTTKDTATDSKAAATAAAAALDRMKTAAGKDKNGDDDDTAEDPELKVIKETSTIKWMDVLWTTLGSALFIAGVVLLGIGIQVMFTSSILTAVANTTDKTSIITIIEYMLIIGLCMIGFFDMVSIMAVLFANDRYIYVFGKYKVRNYLGGHKWVKRNEFRILLISAGLMLFAVNISAILFAVGWIVLVAQISLKTLCQEISNVEFSSVSVGEICLNVPSVSKEPICGWDVLDACYDITNLGVKSIVVGAALLLWCHLVFFMMVLVSLNGFYSYKISWTGAVKAQTLKKES